MFWKTSDGEVCNHRSGNGLGGCSGNRVALTDTVNRLPLCASMVAGNRLHEDGDSAVLPVE